MAKLYTFSFVAVKDNQINHSSEAVTANSEKSAADWGQKRLYQLFPQKDGYIAHSLSGSVVELPNVSVKG